MVFNMSNILENVVDIPDLTDVTGVFFNRDEAGKVLAEMMKDYINTDAIIFGIPAGGIPVASAMADKLNLELDVVVVSKITLPWNTEAGYGAVSFDGTVELNRDIISQTGLNQNQITEGIEIASTKVQRRFNDFRGSKSFPNIENRTVILVDDGIASGFTMLVAVEAMKNAGAEKIIIAVPTAHLNSLEKIASKVDKIYCANIRGGWGFAVADAYKNWYDVSEEEVREILGKRM